MSLYFLNKLRGFFEISNVRFSCFSYYFWNNFKFISSSAIDKKLLILLISKNTKYNLVSHLTKTMFIFCEMKISLTWRLTILNARIWSLRVRMGVKFRLKCDFEFNFRCTCKYCSARNANKFCTAAVCVCTNVQY